MEPAVSERRGVLDPKCATYRVIHAQKDQQWDGGHPSADPLLKRHRAVPVVVHPLQHLLQYLRIRRDAIVLFHSRLLCPPPALCLLFCSEFSCVLPLSLQVRVSREQWGSKLGWGEQRSKPGSSQISVPLSKPPGLSGLCLSALPVCKTELALLCSQPGSED